MIAVELFQTQLIGCIPTVMKSPKKEKPHMLNRKHKALFKDEVGLSSMCAQHMTVIAPRSS